MAWNWQLAAWPDFQWEAGHRPELEARYLVAAGSLAGAFGSLAIGDAAELRADLLSEEAMETSRIEGETLDRGSVQSSIRRQLGLAVDGRRAGPAEQGVAEVMVDAYRSHAEDLSDGKLCHWHALLMKGRHGLRDVGRYRCSAEAMQIVSGPIHAPVVHFEAPPSERVPREMESFIAWFNGSRGRMPALCRAAVAHVYFESIHPFEDGNGRIGRVIAELALSQAIGAPVLLALSQVIGRGKKEYYARLQQANRTLELAAWVEYFSETVMAALVDSERRIDFVIGKARLFERLRGRLNPRQEKVLLRMFAEGPDGFAGGLSAGNYQTIAKTSAATATRDLAELIELGALCRSGERKHTRYRLEIGMERPQL